MTLATVLSSPILLAALTLAQESERSGIPLWVIPVVIFIVLLLIFLSSYFSSTGIQGEKAEATAVTIPAEPPTPRQPDDLKKVEGIGPKIERILHEAGILTFTQLAAAEVSHLEKVVREDAGIRVAFPDTWPEQAKLAAGGAWDTLEKLQDDLKGGRRA